MRAQVAVYFRNRWQVSPEYTPCLYLLAHFRSDPSPVDHSFGDRFCEIDLPLLELMTQKVDISGAVTEALSYDLGRQAFDERGPEGFVTPLPLAFRSSEKRCISHAVLYTL